MALKSYKPTTPGRRGSSTLATTGLSKRKFKRLLSAQRRGSGRNNQGKITVRHRGGGAKRFYRHVDFLRAKFDIPGKVLALEYDPNRTARLALVSYRDGDLRYVLAQEGLTVGSPILTSKGPLDMTVGNRVPLEHVPSGVAISDIELTPGNGSHLVRSAGSAAFVMASDGATAQVKLPSGEVRSFSKDCFATIGQMSNVDWRTVRLGKAGRMRHRGIRPRVRGKAMNPVDHPHGGGEGNQPIGMKHPKTPWGKRAMGVPTRRSKRSDRFLVKRRSAKR